MGGTGVPLPQKLGVRAGSRVLLDGAPEGFDLGPLPTGAVVTVRPANPAYDVVVLFAPDLARLVRRWPVLAGRLTTAGRAGRQEMPSPAAN